MGLLNIFQCNTKGAFKYFVHVKKKRLFLFFFYSDTYYINIKKIENDALFDKCK